MLRTHLCTLATVLTLGVATLGMANDAEAARGEGQHNTDGNGARQNDHRVNRPNRERDQAHNNHGRHDRAMKQSGQYQGHKKAQLKSRKNDRKHARQHARQHNNGRHYAKHANRYYNKNYRNHYQNANWKHANHHYSNHRYYYTNYNHYRSWQPYFGSTWNAYQLTGWQRANGCHPVVKMRGDRYNGRLVGATMCYDNWGETYIVARTKTVLYRYH